MEGGGVCCASWTLTFLLGASVGVAQKKARMEILRKRGQCLASRPCKDLCVEDNMQPPLVKLQSNFQHPGTCARTSHSSS